MKIEKEMHLAYKTFEIKIQANITLRIDFVPDFFVKMNEFYLCFNSVWIQRSCVKIYTRIDGEID